MIKKLVCTTALLVASAISALAVPILSVTPSSNNVTVGATFTLFINVASVVDLYAWQLDVAFGPSGLLNVPVSLTNPAVGGFLGGGQTFIQGTVDNGLATIVAMASSLSGSTGVDGGGILASIDFNALLAGVSTISLSNLQLFNSNLDQIFTSNPLSATVNISSAVIPEPSTFVLLGIGLACGALVRRRI